jgi:hypothetical protein
MILWDDAGRLDDFAYDNSADVCFTSQYGLISGTSKEGLRRRRGRLPSRYKVHGGGYRSLRHITSAESRTEGRGAAFR